MNILVRLGLWWEQRRPVRRAEFDALKKKLEDATKITYTGELARMKVQLDRVELFVGLKRDAKPVVVPGAARIE